MSYPIQPTKFNEYFFKEEWYEKDFFYSPDGVREFPDHHCKLSFNGSLPFLKEQKRNAVDLGCRDGEFSRYLQHHFNHVYGFDPRYRKFYPYNVKKEKNTHFQCKVDNGALALDKFNIEDVDYLKIDVDGSSEYVVVQGCLKTIEKYNPVINLEVKSTALNRVESGRALDFLLSIGYKVMGTCYRGWDHYLRRD